MNGLIVSIKRQRDIDRAKTNSKYMLFKTKWDRKERKKGKSINIPGKCKPKTERRAILILDKGEWCINCGWMI